ncbi:MAG: sulfite exporter TauE/SafE family protein [Pseudomonadota bacterium]
MGDVDWLRYWFMFPISIGVATTAMLSGIGGAALFIPIFLIIFPLLGPEYPLDSAVAAIGVALLTETFGFSSGFVGYYRKRLIDFRAALPFLAVGVPVAIAGALIVFIVGNENEAWLKGGYGVVMLAIAAIMVFHSSAGEAVVKTCAPAAVDKSAGAMDARPRRRITARDGKIYTYHMPRQGRGAVATGLGGLLTGMVGVGMGEVVIPQLVKRNGVPVPVAAATSVFIVIVTVAAASFTLIYQLIQAGGLSAVPWHLVAYTVPAVVIGGQIGPRLQGKVPQTTMERAIGTLFLCIGLAMIWIVVRGAL